MKKICIVLSFIFVSGLHAPMPEDVLHQDLQLWTAESNTEPPERPFVFIENVPVSTTITTANGEKIVLNDCRMFPALYNAMQDVEIEESQKINIPLSVIDKAHFKAAQDLAKNKLKKLPAQNKHFRYVKLLEALNFLGVENYLEKFYIAWLNRKENLEKNVIHDLSATELLKEIGIPAEFELSKYEIDDEPEDLSTRINKFANNKLTQRSMSLTNNNTTQIVNYENRKHGFGSIQDADYEGVLPQINNKVLDVSSRGIEFLEGLETIADIEKVEKLRLDGNLLKSISPFAFEFMTNLKELYLDNNELNDLRAYPKINLN